MEVVVRSVGMSMAFSLVSMVLIFLVGLFLLSLIPWFRQLRKLSILFAFLGAWVLTSLVIPSMSLGYFMENTGDMYYLQAILSVVMLSVFRLSQSNQ